MKIFPFKSLRRLEVSAQGALCSSLGQVTWWLDSILAFQSGSHSTGCRVRGGGAVGCSWEVAALVWLGLGRAGPASPLAVTIPHCVMSRHHRSLSPSLCTASGGCGLSTPSWNR